MNRTLRLTLFACVAALTIAACGSSYKGLTKAEFVKQATAICVRDAANVDKIGKAVGNSPTLEQVKTTYANQLVPAFKNEVAELRALKPPKEDRKTISKMLDDLSAGVEQAGTAIKSLKSINEVSSLDAPAGMKAANKEANAYGLVECAKA